MLIGTLYFVVFEYDHSRILTYIAVIPVIFIPFYLKKGKGFIDDKELLYYNLFVFLADFLGCVVNLYNQIWWYDLFIHFLSGIYTFIIAFYLLNKMNIKKNSIWFDLLFGICFVMFIASVWEFFEFGVDYFLGMNLQHQIDSGVVDTMEDMIVAFLGGMVASVVVLIRKKMEFIL